jgi:hypothetical protein
MSKKIVITESQLKRLVQYQTKLNESVLFGDGEDFNGDDDEMMDGEDISSETLDNDSSLDMKSDEWDDVPSDKFDMGNFSLNEGQLKLKETFNKLTGNPIIKSLSSEILKK